MVVVVALRRSPTPRRLTNNRVSSYFSLFSVRARSRAVRRDHLPCFPLNQVVAWDRQSNALAGVIDLFDYVTPQSQMASENTFDVAESQSCGVADDDASSGDVSGKLNATEFTHVDALSFGPDGNFVLCSRDLNAVFSFEVHAMIRRVEGGASIMSAAPSFYNLGRRAIVVEGVMSAALRFAFAAEVRSSSRDGATRRVAGAPALPFGTFSVEARSSSRNGARVAARRVGRSAAPLRRDSEPRRRPRRVVSRRAPLPRAQRATRKLQWALSPTLRLGDVQVYGFSRGADAFYGPVTDARRLFCL